MDGATLLTALAPRAGELLDRHLAASKEWFAHELVPWHRAARAAEPELLAPGVRDALVVNVLTEDALPYYTTALYARFGAAGPWWDWARRWTAEEMRHGMVLHDYLAVTRAVDLADLERQRMRYLATASVPTTATVAEAFVYLALQELATRLAHANTARLIRDPDGRRIMARVAADEHLHHRFYRDVVGAALDVDRSATVVAINRQVRHFGMPGHEIPGFADRARAIAAAGIYSIQIFVEQVVEPLLIGAWRIEELTSLSNDAEVARDRTLRFVERMRRIVPRLAAATSVEPGAGAAPPGSL